MKTKAELLKLVEELEAKIEHLENDVDYWIDEYNDMEERAEDLDNQLADMEIANGIKNIHNFIYELKLDNLYNDKLDKFINIYLKYHNY